MLSPPSPKAPDSRHETLMRLARFRRSAIVTAAVLVVLAEPLLGIRLPLLPLGVALLLMLTVNTIFGQRLQQTPTAGSYELLAHLLFDLAALSVLLYFSGGVTNPLISLLLPPVAIAALTLTKRQVALVAGLAIAAYSGLLIQYQPLTLDDPLRATQLHLTGMWLTFVLSAAMIAWLILRLTARVRARDAELAAAREQGLRDEHVLALGTLAAGAAHELGTPLSTLAVLVGELRHDHTLDAGQQADLALMSDQIANCKSILSNLTRRAGQARLETTVCEPVDRWLDQVRQRWHARQPQHHTRLLTTLSGEAPGIVADPRLEQAVVNLLDNAARVTATDKTIELSITATADTLSLSIRDFGPGFPSGILDAAGQMPAPAHTGGQGIGLMLTRSAVEQMGGELILTNEADGARAEIRLPRQRP